MSIRMEMLAGAWAWYFAVGAMMLGWVASLRAADPGDAVLLSVEKIWGQASHNAFTDLVRFNGKFYTVFREANLHGVPPVGGVGGVIRLLESADGSDWISVGQFTLGSDKDMRDGKLVVTPDNRLMLLATEAPLNEPRLRQSYVWFSDNGSTWSNPAAIGDPNYWMWDIAWHGAMAYGIAYGDTSQPSSVLRQTRLYTSTTGDSFQTLVFPLNPEGVNTNETALIFREDGTAVALARTRGAGGDTSLDSSFIGVSSGDFTEWVWQETGVRLGGPALVELPDGRIIAGTRLHGGPTRTGLALLDLEAGTLTEMLALPSGGDTGYPGMVWHNNELWVTFYSSDDYSSIEAAESQVSIYLARIAFTTIPEPTGAATATVLSAPLALIRRRRAT